MKNDLSPGWVEQQRKYVKALAAHGISRRDICKVIRDPRTDDVLPQVLLEEHFSKELEMGMVEANVEVAKSMFRMAVGAKAEYDSHGRMINKQMEPQFKPAESWLRANAGWTYPATVKHEMTGKDGGPIETQTHIDVANLTDSDLEFLEKVIARGEEKKAGIAAAKAPKH